MSIPFDGTRIYPIAQNGHAGAGIEVLSRLTSVLAEQENILRELEGERERYTGLLSALAPDFYQEERHDVQQMQYVSQQLADQQQQQGHWQPNIMDNLLDLPAEQLDHLMAAVAAARSAKTVLPANPPPLPEPHNGAPPPSTIPFGIPPGLSGQFFFNQPLVPATTDHLQPTIANCVIQQFAQDEHLAPSPQRVSRRGSQRTSPPRSATTTPPSTETAFTQPTSNNTTHPPALASTAAPAPIARTRSGRPRGRPPKQHLLTVPGLAPDQTIAFELVRGTTVDTKSVEARADFPIDFDSVLQRQMAKVEGDAGGGGSDEESGEEGGGGDEASKRRRNNTLASARFRQRKKQRSEMLARAAAEHLNRASSLEQRAADLANEVARLREEVKRSFPSQSLEHLYAQNGVSWTSGDPSATWGAASSSGSGPGQPGSTVTMPGGTQHSLQQMSQEQIAMLLGFYGIPDA